MRQIPVPAPVDVLILGGGAAGLMCAATAGQRGLTVRVLESAERIGKKILISGGGRCNFTNRHAGPDNYLSEQPDFCRSALARYVPEDFIGLVERHGIAYHEKKLGQLFCDGSSRQIVEMLAAECAAAGVQITTNCRVDQVERAADGTFAVRRAGEPRDAPPAHTGRALVLATGGLSFPQLGGTGLAYQVAKTFNLRLVTPRPGLVPLTFSGPESRLCAALSGVSVPCVARALGNGGRAFRENLLFTHRGLSGPAVLQVSSYLPAPSHGKSPEVTFDLLPDAPDFEQWLLAERARGREIQLANLLAERLPARLAQRFCEATGPPRPVRRYSLADLTALARQLHGWTMRPSGTEGYAKAEVTLGGIDTRELHGKTMATRQHPGLYCIGEAVDVTGQLGGFNFQWAWASGYAAGCALAERAGASSGWNER